MKTKIKFYIIIFLMFFFLPLKVHASELDTSSEYFAELMKDEDYSAIYNSSQEEIEYITKMYEDGAYTEEEYNKEIEKIITERDKMLSSCEQSILKEKERQQKNEEANKTEKVEGFADQFDFYDENGNKIKDYTNVDFSNFPNKRIITVEGILEEGTATKSNFYIQVNVSARNVIYETSAILDETNNYTVTIPVPNDVYYVYYNTSATEDKVGCEDQLLDVRLNPTITIPITGAIKIDSNEGELMLIEGEEYVETIEEKAPFNWSLIIITIVITIILISIIIGIVFIIKIKEKNKI